MEPALYTQTVVKRDLTYEYYYSPASAGHPILFFLHGFPSTSHDWYKQIGYFQPLGYGILAPDILGAGRTARPLDSKDWKLNLIAADMVDIMDKEHLIKVVGVGHDWGCVALSRLAVLYPERFHGFVWLGLSFMEPVIEKFDLDAIMKAMKEYLGYEGYSYWKLFEREDAAEIIQEHVDSFLQLIYPKDASSWLVYMALPGKTEEWVQADMKPGFPGYLSAEDLGNLRRNMLENGGVKASLNWYISQLRNNDLEDSLAIPTERWYIQQPSFFAAALQDCICTPKRGKATMEKYASSVKIVEFDTGHWVHLEAAHEVNKEMESWLVGLYMTAD